jgi:hypothetical protein
MYQQILGIILCSIVLALYIVNYEKEGLSFFSSLIMILFSFLLAFHIYTLIN